MSFSQEVHERLTDAHVVRKAEKSKNKAGDEIVAVSLGN